jgi:hypothetical protein
MGSPTILWNYEGTRRHIENSDHPCATRRLPNLHLSYCGQPDFTKGQVVGLLSRRPDGDVVIESLDDAPLCQRCRAAWERDS